MNNIKIRELVNLQDPLKSHNHYAYIQNQGVVNLRQIDRRISWESTISMMDTLGVREGFLEVIPGYATRE